MDLKSLSFGTWGQLFKITWSMEERGRKVFEEWNGWRRVLGVILQQGCQFSIYLGKIVMSSD